MDAGPGTPAPDDPARLAEMARRLAQLPDPVRLLEGLFAFAPVAFQIYRADGRSLLTNRAFRDLFGSEPPPGYNVLEDEIAAEQGVLGRIQRAFAGETVYIPPLWYDPRELRQVEVPEGRRVAMDATFFPLRDAAGAVAYVAIAFRDYTAEILAREDAEARRREAEAAAARMAFLADAGALLGASLEPEETLTSLAGMLVPALGDLCGVLLEDEQGALRRVAERSADPELARRLRTVPLPPVVGAALAAELRAGQAASVDDFAAWVEARVGPDAPYARLVREERVERVLLAPLVARGRTLGLIGLAHLASSARSRSGEDLTLLREVGLRAGLAVDNARLFAQAREARARAEEASRAKDAFLAMLGHELRNPLAPITTALELMRLRAGETLARERAVIERQVGHLVRLVGDLLDVARITRGHVQLERARVELSAVVASALEMCGPRLEQRHQRLGTAVPTAGLAVIGDAQRLAQVVANLLTNAARYSEAGGLIELSAAAEGHEAVLRVRDQGAGIEPELLPRVFDLFVQGPRARERADGGLGLGLAIVRGLVEAHGGRVAMTSPGPGGGTEVTVWLPLAPPIEEPGDAAPPAAALPRVTRRVLVVDDNRDAALALGELLEACGHEVAVAHDAAEALEEAGATLPEVALLDLDLPGVDGCELGRRLRALPGGERLRLVAVTGYGQDADRARTAAAGFDAHLVKPPDVARLLELVAAGAREAGAPSG